jgi:hypothetical protein
MGVRALAKALALNRMAFGVGYVLAPARSGGGWIGSHAENPGARVFARALGARDLGLGIGALRALTRGDDDSARAWMAAHAVSDGTDLLATLAARKDLNTRPFAFALGMAGASLAIALAGALALD